MPPMTRRRRWYDLGIIGLRTIADEGWRRFWWKIRIFSKQKKEELHNLEIPIKKNEPREEELERIRGEFENEGFHPLGDGKVVHKPVSIGVAQYIFQEELRILLKRTDANMYHAKGQGKNRVFYRKNR